jgi:hypothetical protein
MCHLLLLLLMCRVAVQAGRLLLWVLLGLWVLLVLHW